MTADTARSIDVDAFNGNGTNKIKGILSQGTNTALAAGNTSVKFDDLASAIARIEATGAVPSCVWLSPEAAAALRVEKSSGSGDYRSGEPTNGPANTVWGLPRFVSASITGKAAIVVAGDRVRFGIHKDVRVSMEESIKFDFDLIGFKVSTRVAGVVVAEPTSVQIITPSAT